MSMSLNVALFQSEDEKLQAEYSDLSKNINVTEFLNSFISEDYISEFTVFEEDEEIVYREINSKFIDELSRKSDEIEDALFVELREISGKTKREESINKIQDLTLLNRLIKIYLLSLKSNKSNLVKILIA